ILQALGATPKVNVVVDKLQIRDLDIVVLCSDGLSNKVPMEEINQIVHAAPNLKYACDQLIDLANERGGEDNITVIVAQFSGKALQLNATSPLLSTEPLSSQAGGGTTPASARPVPDRWGAETVPRDSSLPSDLHGGPLDEDLEDTVR